MATRHPFELQVDVGKNRVCLRYFGHVKAADTRAAAAQVELAIPRLRAGFTVLTDLSELDAMDLDCVPALTKIMDLARTAGAGTVVRIVPDPAKDIGFNILSITHLRREVKVVTCATREEAERVL